MGYDTELFYAAANCLREIYTDPNVPLIDDAQKVTILQFLNTKRGVRIPKVSTNDERMLWFAISVGMLLPSAQFHFPIICMFHVNIGFGRVEDRQLGLLYEGIDLAEMYREHFRYRHPV
jgi:hypothetical protein